MSCIGTDYTNSFYWPNKSWLNKLRLKLNFTRTIPHQHTNLWPVEFFLFANAIAQVIRKFIIHFYDFIFCHILVRSKKGKEFFIWCIEIFIEPEFIRRR